MPQFLSGQTKMYSFHALLERRMQADFLKYIFGVLHQAVFDLRAKNVFQEVCLHAFFKNGIARGQCGLTSQKHAAGMLQERFPSLVRKLLQENAFC